MSQIMRRLLSGYNYVFHELGDSRVENFMFMSSPIPVALILIFYLYFVLKLGPRLMKDRPPFNLDTALIAYNILQILASLYIIVKYISNILFKYSLRCEPLVYSTDELSMEIARHVWIYFIIKMVDLLDTVFFILRKKFNQASFLHIYHHTGMVMLGWGSTKYLAGGHGILLGFINSIVHFVMYSYYLLSTWNKEYKQSIWWKKHLTQMQMVQFFILIIYFGQILLQPDCQYPKWAAWVFIPQNVFMLILFSDFYVKTYIKPKQKHAPSSFPASQATKENSSKSD